MINGSSFLKIIMVQKVIKFWFMNIYNTFYWYLFNGLAGE